MIARRVYQPCVGGTRHGNFLEEKSVDRHSARLCSRKWPASRAGAGVWSGKQGKYRHDTASGKIVFSSGPLAKANAKFLNGPRIGLNMNGGSFFNATCGLKK